MAKRPRILCIDNLPENLRIRMMLLEQFGCETVGVENQHAALNAVASREFDLLLIDYHLARGETGEDLARDVRAISPAMPMIMLTGDTKMPESAAETVDAVLIKRASNPRALLDTTQRLLPNAELKPRRHMVMTERKAS